LKLRLTEVLKTHVATTVAFYDTTEKNSYFSISQNMICGLVVVTVVGAQEDWKALEPDYKATARVTYKDWFFAWEDCSSASCISIACDHVDPKSVALDTVAPRNVVPEHVASLFY
jgi:hypothetical protein